MKKVLARISKKPSSMMGKKTLITPMNLKSAIAEKTVLPKTEVESSVGVAFLVLLALSNISAFSLL